MFGQPSHGLTDECTSVKDNGKKKCWNIDPVCKRDTGQLRLMLIVCFYKRNLDCIKPEEYLCFSLALFFGLLLVIFEILQVEYTLEKELLPFQIAIF